MKKSVLIILSFFWISSCFANTDEKSEIISNFKKLSTQQLLDTADHYFSNSVFDIALVYYSLIINTPVTDTDFEQLKVVIEAYNRSANIYLYLGDYRNAYDFYIKALLLCEKINCVVYESKIYNNLGNIYYYFKKYDVAKEYYLKSLHLCKDTVAMAIVLNNLGVLKINNGNFDSTFYYINESLKICKQHYEEFLHGVWSQMALLYQEQNHYDSAFYYYKLSLDAARKNDKIVEEADILSQLGKLFFEVKKTDSALYYIGLSNVIAEKNGFLRALTENYLVLSNIEESKGQIKNAFKYYKKHDELKDSLINSEKFGDINQLQRVYEVAKTNQRIEQLALEQKIKQHTIWYLRIIQFIILSVLFLVSAVLSVIVFQKRRLNRAYKSLFEKNIELIDFQKNSLEKYHEKYRNSALNNNMQGELLNRILTLMEEPSTFCDTEFSVDKLAELVQSNQKYVSQVINHVLKKNFRSFLNSYRIREAQLLFSDPDAKKYTIESIALRVGFKSRNAFREAFKEITGVSPYFYLSSIQEQQKCEM